MSHDNEFPAESSPVVLSKERERTLDDIGRHAGAALRTAPPLDGASRIKHRARNQRIVRVGGLAVGATALIVVGIAVLGSNDSSQRQEPAVTNSIDTASTTEVSTAPPISNTAQPQTSLLVTAGASVSNRGNQQYAERMAYSADGSELAGVGLGFALRMYDTATLAMTRELACPTSLAVGGAAGLTWNQDVATTWDHQSRALKSSMSAPQGFGGDCEIAFSVDDDRAAQTASAATTILWNASDGTQVATLDGISPVFSPDGTVVVTFGTEGAEVWDATSGVSLASLAGDADWLVFSPDGSRFVTLGSGTAELWDTRTLQPITAYNSNSASERFFDAAFTSDGTRLATANGKTAIIWNAATGQQLDRMEGGSGVLLCVAFSPDNTLLATGGIQDEGLRVFDAATGQELANLYRDPVSGCAAFSPDDATLAVTVIPDEFSVSQRGLHLWSYSRD